MDEILNTFYTFSGMVNHHFRGVGPAELQPRGSSVWDFIFIYPAAAFNSVNTKRCILTGRSLPGSSQVKVDYQFKGVADYVICKASLD